MKNLKVLFTVLCLACTSLAWGAIADGTYVLCTSTSDLAAGSHYIIASGNSSEVQCISNVSNANNRKIVAATVVNSKIEVSSTSTIMTFTLGGSTGAWTFSTDNYAGTAGYLASAASGSNNYCRVISTETTGTVSFSNGAAVITLQPHSSRNILRYNSSSSCFACYSSGQAAVYLYKLESGSSATPLSAPTNLQSADITSSSANLSWDAVSNASSYTLKIGDTEYTNATSPYSATGLTAETEYTWTVKAVGDGTTYSSSAYASNANFTTLAPSATPLSLPHSWGASDGLSAYTLELGCTHNITGSDYSNAPKVKFANAGNYLLIQLADAPAKITFNFKQNGSTAGTFLVQESSDGTNFTDHTVTWPGDAQTSSIETNLNSSSRYIKLIYSVKGTSTNAAIGGVSITKAGSTKTSISPVLSYESGSLQVGGGNSSSPTVTGNTGSGACTYSLESVSPAGCATIDSGTGVVTPVAEGSATAKVTIAETESYQSGTATFNFTISAAAAVERTVTWYVNSEVYTTGDPTTKVNDGGKVTTLPTAPTVPDGCSGKVFVGWTNAKISTGTDTQPAVLFKDAASAPTVSGGNASYYAVFATAE